MSAFDITIANSDGNMIDWKDAYRREKEATTMYQAQVDQSLRQHVAELDQYNKDQREVTMKSLKQEAEQYKAQQVARLDFEYAQKYRRQEAELLQYRARLLDQEDQHQNAIAQLKAQHAAEMAKQAQIHAIENADLRSKANAERRRRFSVEQQLAAKAKSIRILMPALDDNEDLHTIVAGLEGELAAYESTPHASRPSKGTQTSPPAPPPHHLAQPQATAGSIPSPQPPATPHSNAVSAVQADVPPSSPLSSPLATPSPPRTGRHSPTPSRSPSNRSRAPSPEQTPSRRARRADTAPLERVKEGRVGKKGKRREEVGSPRKSARLEARAKGERAARGEGRAVSTPPHPHLDEGDDSEEGVEL